ncbi:MAG: methyltransferase domain-containing protein [Halanaerobiales bacterium]|jgi:23S rRNA (guanine745-N1)-methyltransferase|nr:methyltransferase domain-containing protein [Bacillota bacterium]
MSKKGIKKKDRIRGLIENNEALFRCPVCNGAMFMDGYSLSCSESHNFDLARKGYLNLLLSGNAPVYSRDLFEARHEVCRAGFYGPLIERIAEIIAVYRDASNLKKMSILDAGCGEGSHIYGLSQILIQEQNYIYPEENRKSTSSEGQQEFTYVGVDISKDSISIAARNDADIIWCVADLARLPFQDRSFDLVLNILSPANYGEFERILKEQGMVIKVVPGANYLKELRELLYGSGNLSGYSNTEVIDHFKEKLNLEEIQDINYKFDISKEILPHFIKMTPLSWGINGESLDAISRQDIPLITVNLTLLIGTKK